MNTQLHHRDNLISSHVSPLLYTGSDRICKCCAAGDVSAVRAVLPSHARPPCPSHHPFIRGDRGHSALVTSERTVHALER